MIINGGSRRNGGYFAKHFMRMDHNEAVEIVEMRGLVSDNLPDAFRELRAIARGTKCVNYFYHANLNPREDEQLTPEQWQLAADTLERELGLTDQPRFIVQHLKDGRTHQHVIWGRIDADSMTAISDSLTYRQHERAARAIEAQFELEPVASVLVKDRETERPERNPKDWESLRAVDSKIDPKALKAEVTELWKAADSGSAFAAALEDRGYILVRGDSRDFCIIDQHGDEHSLARRLSGVKAAAVRERMADVDREALPSVAEGRELARARADASGDAGSTAPQEAAATPVEAPAGDAAPSPAADDLDTRHAQRVAALRQPTRTTYTPTPAATDDPEFDAVHARTVARAIASHQAAEAEEAAQPGSRFERVRSWWGRVRERFDDWRDHLQERVAYYRSQWQHETPDEPAATAAPSSSPGASPTTAAEPTPPPPSPEPER